MHCNLRPPEPRQSLSALITPPCQVWSRWTYPLPYYSDFAADALLFAVTLTSDLWPWTLTAYHLWRDETLYQIWMQSSNPRRSYCDFSVWLYDRKQCVTCCARLWDNLHQVWPSLGVTIESLRAKRDRISTIAPTRSVWSKISGTRGRHPPIVFARLVRPINALQLCCYQFSHKETL